MAYEFLSIRRDGAVERLTLKRPDVRNALNEQLIAEITAWAAAAHEAARRHEIRAVILAGAGSVFCAGGDAKWMAGTIRYTRARNLADARTLAEMFIALDTLPAPVVCRVQGGAFGGGAGLAAVSDIVIADDRATFAFPEVKLGIAPGVISPFVIAKTGESAARELFLTGARISASRAKEIGLVHAVVAEGDLDARVAEYIREILTNAPGAVAATKALIRQVRGIAPQDAAATTTELIATLRVAPEGQEGLKAFLEKRKPSWSA
jgi:methylglutaconyl-CoA hydratase